MRSETPLNVLPELLMNSDICNRKGRLKLKGLLEKPYLGDRELLMDVLSDGSEVEVIVSGRHHERIRWKLGRASTRAKYL